MLQFSDRSNRLYKISYSSPYNLVEIKNYYDDISVLGEVATYKKYKDKIEQIIKEGTNNREIKVIPSVYEERFILEVFQNNDLKKVCNIFNGMENLFETRKDLTKEDKIKIFDNILKENNMQNQPIYTLKDKQDSKLSVSVYPVLKDTRDNDVFISYYTIVSNNENQIKYGDHSMMIGYLTNSVEENRIKKYMYEVGESFKNDIAEFMIDAKNLNELKYMIEDNIFYDNYRSPMIAFRKNGLIMEISKQKGELISSLYESENNVDKGKLITTKRLSNNELDIEKIQSIDELKVNCMNIIVDQLEDTKNKIEETEEEDIL